MDQFIEACKTNPLILVATVFVILAIANCFLRLLDVNRSMKTNSGALILERAESERSAGTLRSQSFTVGKELEGTEKLLYDAGVEMSVSNYNTAKLAAGALAAVVLFIAGLGPVSLVGMVAAYILPGRMLKSKAAKRALEMERQLMQAEMQIAENSRAGLSVERSIKTCMMQMEQPLRDQFERLYNEISYSNATLVDAINNMAKRTGSKDVKLLAQVISVQQETGANLADTLDFLSDTIGKKMEMRRTLRAKLAETKMTRIVVGLAPLLVMAMCSFTINGFLDFYKTNPFGWMILAGAFTWELLGLYVLKKIGNIKVE